MAETIDLAPQGAQPSSPPPEAEPASKLNGGQAAPWDGTIKLNKPVPDGSGGMVSELKFREPTGNDIVTAGLPVIPGVGLDPIAMNEMLARLAGVPPSTIKSMHAKDWTNATYKIWRFFLPDTIA
jgi:hypothetical protein